MTGIERIAAERRRQIEVEGWTPEHDRQHVDGELAMAACCYAAPVDIRALVSARVACHCREAGCGHGMFPVRRWVDPWPWSPRWDKRALKKHSRIRRLEIAGALIAAEIDRLSVVKGEYELDRNISQSGG
jgi:hypothetical protein